MAEQPASIYRQEVERYCERVDDPVVRLRFLRLCSRLFRGESFVLERKPAMWRWRSRVVALESLWLASGPLKPGEALVLLLYRRRRALRRCAGLVLIWLLILPLTGVTKREGPVVPAMRQVRRPLEPKQVTVSRIWLVEASAGAELYSNGLRILNEWLTHSEARHTRPAGIVYHTSESDLVPLEPSNTELIRQHGRGLLDYVRRRQLYSFVVDRFGRVNRVVPEEEVAHHAGNSVWADAGDVFVNLNQTFIGIAFEARTGAQSEVTAAQLHSAALLTEMLRSRWNIREGNCVSHDLVSVNPDRGLIGHHTDWGGAFPYDALKLPNQYERPTPSIALFGFRYDAAFVEALGGRVWTGICLAEESIAHEAARQGLSPERYRRQLQQQYLRRRGAG